ncbi:hypothetical protein DC498_25370 [Terrimonas sp.]|uniref:hypothetical protein n=1 Tax=Terrimonas sp. TaxID=1914338 RepID=UPI000D51D9C3|nr:hypothetical protein [Terrimonas sp.]PVD49370.1 hypothetical protein DC498_25370 [Terrimonas sp.]
MNAHSKDKKTFLLSDNDQLLGELIYETPFYLKAEIKMSNTETYKLAPVGFFGTSVSVTKDGNKIASLSMSWNGKIIITFQDEREYALKLSGLFQSKMILEDKNQQNVLQFEPKFNWRDFYCKYDIIYDITNDKEPKDKLLLLLGVYAANYFIATISGANAGLM